MIFGRQVHAFGQGRCSEGYNRHRGLVTHQKMIVFRVNRKGLLFIYLSYLHKQAPPRLNLAIDFDTLP